MLTDSEHLDYTSELDLFFAKYIFWLEDINQ